MGEPDNFVFGIEQMSSELNIRRNLSGPRTVLFLGSRTSSLFRNPSLAEILERFSPRDFSKMTKLEKFRECYKVLDKWREKEQYNDIHTYIDLALQGKSVQAALQGKKDEIALQERHTEVADLCVAELMKKRIFDAIITTNIGDDLENAFWQSSLRKGQDYTIALPRPAGSAISPVPKGNAFEMIKINGDFASNQYSIWGYNIKSKAMYVESYKKLNTSIEEMGGEHMLMVGFDDVWDEHMIHTVFHRKDGTLWYVNEEKTREDSPIFPYIYNNEKVARFEGTLVSGYDLFFVNLCFHTLHTIPTNQITLDKLTQMEKTLATLQETQSDLQRDVTAIRKALQNQETTLDALNRFLDKAATFSTQPAPIPFADAPANPIADATPSVPAQKKTYRRTKNAKQHEEK